MLEALLHALSFIAGLVAAALAWLVKHRKLVDAVLDWAEEALKDGKLDLKDFITLAYILVGEVTVIEEDVEHAGQPPARSA